MTDTSIEAQVKFLDDMIKGKREWFKTPIWIDRKKTNEEIAMLQAIRESMQPREVDEDLVEKIAEEASNPEYLVKPYDVAFYDKEGFQKKLRQLLQAQPGVTVTKEEIRQFATSLFRVIPGPEKRLEMEDKLEGIFKSIGIKVREKSKIE